MDNATPNHPQGRYVELRLSKPDGEVFASHHIMLYRLPGIPKLQYHTITWSWKGGNPELIYPATIGISNDDGLDHLVTTPDPLTLSDADLIRAISDALLISNRGFDATCAYARLAGKPEPTREQYERMPDISSSVNTRK